jgi:hypothetical protein
MRYLVLLALTPLLVACIDERPPQWVNMCVESHTDTIPIYTPGKGMSFAIMSVCDRHERVCVVGKDYKGLDKTCKTNQ